MARTPRPKAAARPKPARKAASKPFATSAAKPRTGGRPATRIRPAGAPAEALPEAKGNVPSTPKGNVPALPKGPVRTARSLKPAKPKPSGPRTEPKPANLRRGRAASEGERLQKILASAGVDSRRNCEAIILAGRVQVNGVTVTELGTKADPRRDEITVDFVPIHKEEPVYVLLNKPKGYVTTVKDDQGRPTVMALIHGVPARIYPVGRLDFNSEGLLLLTNDGELAQKLSGPDHEVPKVYLVKIHRQPKPETLKELQEGFRLDGQRLKPCRIEYFDKADNPWMKVTLTEGKNQQIRRMFAAVGHPVSKLRRVQFGPLTDPALKPGEWRFLSPGEMAAIRSL